MAQERGLLAADPDAAEEVPARTLAKELRKAPRSPEVDKASGHVAQSMRWLALSLFAKNEELGKDKTGWRARWP